MAEPEQIPKTYRGNCHCGAFVYEVDLAADIKATAQCNCSVCTKKGYLWSLPIGDSFKVVKGDEKDLSVYTFGKETVRHFVRPQTADR